MRWNRYVYSYVYFAALPFSLHILFSHFSSILWRSLIYVYSFALPHLGSLVARSSVRRCREYMRVSCTARTSIHINSGGRKTLNIFSAGDYSFVVNERRLLFSFISRELCMLLSPIAVAIWHPNILLYAPYDLHVKAVSLLMKHRIIGVDWKTSSGVRRRQVYYKYNIILSSLMRATQPSFTCCVRANHRSRQSNARVHTRVRKHIFPPKIFVSSSSFKRTRQRKYI